MSYSCKNCGVVIMEDDENLCSGCIKIVFSFEEMEKCFKAGCDFGRDMLSNPSNSEYMQEIILRKS